MKDGIAFVAGFFLMIASLALIFGTLFFLIGSTHPLLISTLKIAGLVVAITTIIGLFYKNVFRCALTWLGVR